MPIKPNSIIIQIPPLNEGDKPAEIWFERGVFWFRDPKNREDVREVTMSHMSDAIACFNEFLRDDTFDPHCGIIAYRNFVHKLNELWAWAKTQLHSSTDPSIISEEARERRPVAKSMHLPNGLISGGSTIFKQGKSGLIVPE
jgi:hypothetical protein